MQVPQTELFVRAADGSELLRTSLKPGEYDIGRVADCALLVEAEGVSRRHARLTINYDHALIEDLGSSNGTSVNGQPIDGVTRLWPGQRIQIGSTTVELRRQKTLPLPDVSLAPSVAITHAILPEELLRGRKYDITGVVAQGGMGAILNAKEGTIERSVAMKVMLDGSSPDDLVRFIAEARVTGQLEHPNIVPVHELGVDENDQVFYTMKYVKGITLRKVLEELAAGDAATIAKYPLGVLLTVFQKVCDAVAFAHSKGVIHRDLKPENIMLGDYGEVLLMDWGLAKILGKDESGGMKDEGTGSASDDVGRSLLRAMPEASGATMGGAIMGTPQYMSPEQARGEVEALDARADIYALGAILFHLLALRPSVAGGDAMTIVGKVARGEIEPLTGPLRTAGAFSLRRTGGATPVGEMAEARPPREPRVRTSRSAIPDSLAAVVRKAMAFEPARRYVAVTALQADVTAFQNGFATSAEAAGLTKQLALLIRRHRGIFTTTAAAALLVSVLGIWFILNLRAKEQRATEGEQAAKQAGAVAAEKTRETQLALVRSALSLAEAALREGNGSAMQAALKDVPPAQRDTTWRYLLEQSDTSVARVSTGASHISGAAAHPLLPDVFAVADSNQKVSLINVRTGVRLLEFTPAFPPQTEDVRPDQTSVLTYALAISPDGERIAVGRLIRFGNAGGGIVVHSARDGKKLLEWPAPQTARLEFSADGKLLLQSSTSLSFTPQGMLLDQKNERLSMWDAASGRLAWDYSATVGTHCTRGTFTPDGHQVLTFGWGDDFRLVNAEDGKLLRGFKIEGDPVTALAMKTNDTVVAADQKGMVRLIDLREGRVASKFPASKSELNFLTLSSKGNLIVTGTALPDGRQALQVWNATTGEPQQALLGGQGAVGGFSVHPLSGDLLVSGPETRVWSLQGKPATWELPGLEFVPTRPVFWGADDVLFATGLGAEGALLKLQNGSAALLWRPEVSSGARADVSADEKVAAFGWYASRSRMLLLRRSGTQPETICGAGLIGDPYFVRLSATGERAAVVDTRNRLMIYSNLLKPADMTSALVGSKDVKRFHDLRWLESGGRLLGLITAHAERGAPGSEERIVTWDATTHEVLRSVTHQSTMDSLALAPDGRRFAEAGADKTVRIRDTATLAVLQEFRAHDGPITALAWHPTKPILATASADLTIRLWNLETGQRLEELRGPTDQPTGLAFSPGGQRLACSSGDATRIWEPISLGEKGATVDSKNGR